MTTEELKKYGSALAQAQYWVKPEHDQGETKVWMGQTYIDLFSHWRELKFEVEELRKQTTAPKAAELD